MSGPAVKNGSGPKISTAPCPFLFYISPAVGLNFVEIILSLPPSFTHLLLIVVNLCRRWCCWCCSCYTVVIVSCDSSLLYGVVPHHTHLVYTKRTKTHGKSHTRMGGIQGGRSQPGRQITHLWVVEDAGVAGVVVEGAVGAVEGIEPILLP